MAIPKWVRLLDRPKFKTSASEPVLTLSYLLDCLGCPFPGKYIVSFRLSTRLYFNNNVYECVFVLSQASVHVDSPRGFTARFMTNMWAMFAVVFLAIYTANLAAFMITREEFHELSGLDDPRISRPLAIRPPLKFGTVPWSHTDATLAKYFREPHAYMAQ